ncbi:hypothetical protein [Hydrogenophaga electricum]|uniref:DUF4377 domain-containing protein n=1 Tax=Hydrogenophaga electricum TaxID=1230953 RepID=A0ABQ6C5X5_9BURK|nr:hypothetical protein [Hydrogenophaga electricum]GLS13602.1 hypothetical protein GCM10007935_10320 [Hydrogenophaga electricum]
MATTLRHIAGSVFGLALSTEQCPIATADAEPVDMAGWGVALRLIGTSYTAELPGTWLTTTDPAWSFAFEVANTLPWPPGTYAARLVYTEPAPASRRFEVETAMAVEVIR